MALFEIDSQQFQQLDSSIDGLNGAVNRLAEAVAPVDSSVHAAIGELSTNIGKWQAQQMATIESGFANLIAVLTGVDVAEVQKQINQHALNVSAAKESLQSALNRNQPKGEE